MTSLAEPLVFSDGRTRLVRRWPAEGPAWCRLLLVHGLGEHSGRYEAIASQLASVGIEVRAFDLSGFGASSGRRAYVETWSTYLDEVEEELSRLTGPKVLLGYSMGGLIALEYCLAERPPPDLLVLSAPALGGGRGWQRALAPLIAAVAPRLRLPTKITGEQLSRDPEVGKAYFADPLVLRTATAKLGAELFAAIDRTLANLSRLSVPTLVIHGASDTLVPPVLSLPLHELPGVNRRLYPGLCHETCNEPEGRQVVGDVAAWLKANLTPRS
jgi:alpha-beta hydrolase superfamily lysophospholipase